MKDYNKKEIKEDATQASSVASGLNGKIDVMGTNVKSTVDKDIYEQLFELKDWNESPDDLEYEATQELMDYLNEHTNLDWDLNEMYDNCVITEANDNYIEVFVNVDVENYKVTYEIDNNNYSSLEDVVENLPHIEQNGYCISYGRGDVIEFDTIEEAKEWQVENIWEDNYANYAEEDPEDETNPESYGWEDMDVDNYVLEFVMFDKNGNKYDTDTSDGAGWFIQKI